MSRQCFARKPIAIELVVAALVLGACASQPYRLVVVQGGSMCPTYGDGSLHVEQLVKGSPYKGEVVVVNSPVGTIIKRVAYLSGEKIREVRFGNEWIDLIEFNVGRKPLHILKERTYVVPSGKVYVLSDNRIGSLDSRTFGPVRVSDISGALTDQKPRLANPMDTEWQATLHGLSRKPIGIGPSL